MRERKTGRKKNTHYAVNRIKSRTTSFLSRGTQFSHVYRARDSLPDCDDIVISPSLDGTPFPKISSNFSPRTFVFINEGLNGAEIFCLQNRNEHGPYSNFRNEHSRFFQ